MSWNDNNSSCGCKRLQQGQLHLHFHVHIQYFIIFYDFDNKFLFDLIVQSLAYITDTV